MIKYNSGDLVDHHGVSAIIKNSEGKILMQSHNKYGFWTIPVGKTKNNQTPIEGFKEEILEECNIKVLDFKEIVYKELDYIRDEHEVKVLTHIYEVLNYSGKIKNNEPEKHSEQVFLSIEEIIKKPLLSDSTILYLDYLDIKREAKLSK